MSVAIRRYIIKSQTNLNKINKVKLFHRFNIALLNIIINVQNLRPENDKVSPAY